MDHHTTLTLRRELHNFLGDVPEKIQTNQDKALAGLCITLGNFLIFAGPLLEKGAKAFPALHDQPESLSDLGKKFRSVGLELWDEKPKKTPRDLDVAEIRNRLADLDGLIRASLVKGGAK